MDTRNVSSRQASVEGEDLPPVAEGGQGDGLTDEAGTAKDQQTQAIMSRPGQVRGIVASGRPAPALYSPQGSR